MIVSTLVKRSLAVGLFVCLASSLVSAQVHIREKIQIKPLQTVRMQSGPSTTHRLRVDVQWDQPWFGRFDTYTPCGLRSDTGTSQISFTIDPAPGGSYPHFSLFLNRPAGQTAHVIFELYLDDQLVTRDSTLYGQFSNDWPDASFNTPYFDGFHFALPPDPVFYEEGTMGEVTGFNQCGSTTSWTPSTDIVTLTIVSGSDYVQFWNVADYPRVPMGSSISVLASQLQNYMLAADGTLPDSQGVWVNVKAESNGIEETDSVLVVPYYLQFVFNPDSVQSGGESRIVIKTVDAQGDDHVRLIEPLVSVAIQDSTEYGTLSYNEFGEVLADTIDGIQTLLIADEFSGVELKFLANEKVPTQTFPVTLFAKKTDEGLSFFPIPPSLYPFPGRDTVKGEGKLVLKAQQGTNHPPEIIRIDFSPNRRYFALGSSVTVSANVFDADEDSITVQILPSEIIQLTDAGIIPIIVIAIDSNGASDEERDTMYVVDAAIHPTSILVIDGKNVSFEINVEPVELTPTSYSWGWRSTKEPAGNNPSVVFQPENGQSTVIPVARWYAYPDDPCSAMAVANYEIDSRLIFGQDTVEATPANLGVEVPVILGHTGVPFIGKPEIETILSPSGHVIGYRVKGVGTLQRTVKTEIYIPQTSQFYNQTSAHEQVHYDQFTTGILIDYKTVQGFYERIKNFSASTMEDLEKMVRDELFWFTNDEVDRIKAQWGERIEGDAYLVSDAIPPFYFLGRCR